MTLSIVAFITSILSATEQSITFFNVMLSVIMLSVVMLSVFMLNVVMLSVMTLFIKLLTALKSALLKI